MDWLMTTLLVIGGAYILLCAFFYFFQHLFFFRPEILPSGFSYKYPFDFEEHTFEMEDGGSVNSIYFKVPNSRGVVYYLKGNSKSIKGWGKFAKDFLGNGFDFFMLDYRGFGKSRGKRTERILFNDAQHLYKWLMEHYSEDQIIVYGRSLGSGIGARVASWNRPNMLILDSPYFNFIHNMSRYGFYLPLRWILRYRLRTDQFIKSMKCPVHIIHGTKDWLIPISNSKKLQALDPEKVALYEIEGAGHNNLPDYGEYHQLLYDLMDKAFKGEKVIHNN